MLILQDLVIPAVGLVFSGMTFYHNIMDRLHNMQQQIGVLMANDARFEEHFRHLDKDVEELKRAVKHGH